MLHKIKIKKTAKLAYEFSSFSMVDDEGMHAPFENRVSFIAL